MRSRKIFFCAAAFLMLIAPLLFFGNQDSMSVLRENRNLADSIEAPESIKDINRAYTEKIENYFTDHIGFRNTLVSLANRVRIRILGANSVTTKIIEGKEGWLFYNPRGHDGDPMGEYLGTVTYTQEDLDTLLTFMKRADEVCREVGTEFFVIIAPNKAEVYGELYLPDYYRKREGPGRADLLVNNIGENSEIKCTYVKDELIKYRDTEYTYFKHDTHWTDLGAYLAYRDWYEKYTGIVLPDIEEADRKEAPYCNDLSLQLGVELEEETYYTIDLGRDIEYTEHPEAADVDYIPCFSTNLNGKKAIMYRDSFLGYIQPYLLQDFETSMIYPRQMSEEDFEIIRNEKPDVVIFEMVERRLP